ncbi:hypothetical protein ACTL6U_11945 [Rhodovibrionaceae bacterium A322]
MKKPRSPLVILLVLSILLNFAFGAFVLTQLLRANVLEELVITQKQAYPPQFEEAYRQALRDDWRSLWQDIQTLRQARQMQHEMLTAETFDRSAFEEAMTRLRTAQLTVISRLQAPLPDVVAELPDDIRRDLPLIRLRSFSQPDALPKDVQ